MAEGEAAVAEREARRRRIAERGSDRMALITGRIQTLTPPSSPTFVTSSQSEHMRLPPLPDSNRSHFRNKTEGDVPVTSKMEHTISSKFSRGKAFNYRSKAEASLSKSNTNGRTVPARDMEVEEDEKEPLIVSPKIAKASSTDMKMLRKQLNIYSPKEINSCIVETESTRVFCSVVIALLVVLSNANLPHSIVKSTSTIASRPLYILLLSDVTIVVLKLLQKRRDTEKFEEEEKLDPPKDGPNWVEAVQILEVGLVFYQTVRGLFIDISCYMVVVICGLCLV